MTKAPSLCVPPITSLKLEAERRALCPPDKPELLQPFTVCSAHRGCYPANKVNGDQRGAASCSRSHSRPQSLSLHMGSLDPLSQNRLGHKLSLQNPSPLSARLPVSEVQGAAFLKKPIRWSRGTLEFVSPRGARRGNSWVRGKLRRQ